VNLTCRSEDVQEPLKATLTALLPRQVSEMPLPICCLSGPQANYPCNAGVEGRVGL